MQILGLSDLTKKIFFKYVGHNAKKLGLSETHLGILFLSGSCSLTPYPRCQKRGLGSTVFVLTDSAGNF
jgi:hypothetical protein